MLLAVYCGYNWLRDKNMGNHNSKELEFFTNYGYKAKAMTDRPIGILAKKAIAIKLEENL